VLSKVAHERGRPSLIVNDYTIRRESDMLVVVMIIENNKSEGAKGHYYNTLFSNNLKDELMFKNQTNVQTGKQEELFKISRRKLPAAERVKLIQEKLYNKAKQERGYKFYVLYDKMFIPFMLQEGYARVKSNGGSPGIDNKTFQDIEKDGLEKFLNDLGEDLRKRTYKPMAVKRVWIEKANGGKRPLGIPCIRDRVAQAVCKMIIEPIFEADFEDCSYGFRPNRSSKDALKAIKENLIQGKVEVLDADLSSYFDTIPHDRLMIALKQRIADSRILDLIDKWLKCTVFEDGEFKSGKKRKEGTPQGGVISPLLANIYMHLVDKLVNDINRVFYKMGVNIVRYADDFVLMGKRITKEVIDKLKEVLTRMGLTLNESKTKLINAKERSFNFLGFTIRYSKDIQGRNTKYWNIQASVKAEKKVREKVSTLLKKGGHFPPKMVAHKLNLIINGWLNYFDVPKVSYPAMNKRKLRYYLVTKLNRYYNRKSQRKSRLSGQQAFNLLVSKYGLLDPTKHFSKTQR
jgi:RNA-directed DNA polymerase